MCQSPHCWSKHCLDTEQEVLLPLLLLFSKDLALQLCLLYFSIHAKPQTLCKEQKHCVSNLPTSSISSAVRTLANQVQQLLVSLSCHTQCHKAFPVACLLCHITASRKEGSPLLLHLYHDPFAAPPAQVCPVP